MQIHDIKPKFKRKKKKLIGRGGKKGTYSGKGNKGQKSRAGAGIKPGFRGGDTPIWKLFPKQRGATKKLKVKKQGFALRHKKQIAVNFIQINKKFKDGEIVSPKTLHEKGLISTMNLGVKILTKGELERKVTFENVSFSKSTEQKFGKPQKTKSNK